jgi:hypothetical protein
MPNLAPCRGAFHPNGGSRMPVWSGQSPVTTAAMSRGMSRICRLCWLLDTVPMECRRLPCRGPGTPDAVPCRGFRSWTGRCVSRDPSAERAEHLERLQPVPTLTPAASRWLLTVTEQQGPVISYRRHASRAAVGHGNPRHARDPILDTVPDRVLNIQRVDQFPRHVLTLVHCARQADTQERKR